jgi:hypothetical protein
VVNATPRPLHPPGKRPCTHFVVDWVGPRIGVDECGKSRPPTRIRFQDRLARGELLYRLSYPGPHLTRGSNAVLTEPTVSTLPKHAPPLDTIPNPFHPPSIVKTYIPKIHSHPSPPPPPPPRPSSPRSTNWTFSCSVVTVYICLQALR